jgi:hypothetical protein
MNTKKKEKKRNILISFKKGKLQFEVNCHIYRCGAIENGYCGVLTSLAPVDMAIRAQHHMDGIIRNLKLSTAQTKKC